MYRDDFLRERLAKFRMGHIPNATLGPEFAGAPIIHLAVALAGWCFMRCLPDGTKV